MKDMFLTSFVNAVNTNVEDFSFDVTLTVGGLVVSGNVISYQKYLSLNSQLFKESGETAAIIGGIFDNLLEKNLNESHDNEDPNLIHLENAVIFNNSPQGIPLRLWRGDLNKVDGFTFGKLTIG